MFNAPYRLHATVQGSGPPVVLLHGLAGSSANWNKLTAQLRDNYTCVSIDLLGFGESPKPLWVSYTPDQHIRSIRHTIKRLGVKKPYIVIGHSLGSLLALRYAAVYRSEVSKLYLLSPPIYKSDAASKRRAYHRFVESLYDRLYRRLRTHKNATLGAARRLRRILPDSEQWMLDETTWVPFARSLEQCIEKQNPYRDLKKLSTAVHIFYGTRDRLLSVANIKAITEPNVELHQVKSGHSLDKNYTDAVTKNIEHLNPV